MAPECLTRPALLHTEVIKPSTKTMNANEINIEQVLTSDRLIESRYVSTFAAELPREVTIVKLGDVHVGLHSIDRSAIIVVDYPAGMGRDTAFVGEVEDAHNAMGRLADHGSSTVILDRFDILLDEDGDRR